MYQPLIEQLSDPAPSVRQIAAWSLGRLGYKESLKALTRVLRGDADEMVRVAAAEALGRIGDPAAAPALMAALEDTDLAVRRVSVVNLPRLKDQRAVAPLKAAMEREENADMRRDISRALEALTGVRHTYQSATQRKIERYTGELAKRPNDGHAHYNLAVAYYYDKQYALASIHCQIAKKLGAGVAWVERRLAEALASAPPPPEDESDQTEGALVARVEAPDDAPEDSAPMPRRTEPAAAITPTPHATSPARSPDARNTGPEGQVDASSSRTGANPTVNARSTPAPGAASGTRSGAPAPAPRTANPESDRTSGTPRRTP